jgi:hypothetical protein
MLHMRINMRKPDGAPPGMRRSGGGEGSSTALPQCIEGLLCQGLQTWRSEHLLRACDEGLLALRCAMRLQGAGMTQHQE